MIASGISQHLNSQQTAMRRRNVNGDESPKPSTSQIRTYHANDNEEVVKKNRKIPYRCLPLRRLFLFLNSILPRPKLMQLVVFSGCIYFASRILHFHARYERYSRSIPHTHFMRYYSNVHPISIRFDDISKNQPRKVLPYQTEREIEEWTKDDERRQKALWNDEEYDSDTIQPFTGYEKQPNCKPMYEWQLHHYPTCNSVHEKALSRTDEGTFLASGWYRQTFEVNDSLTKQPIAMKTLKYERDFYPNLLDRHRVDAVIYERTAASPWITDMYSYCAYAGLFEYANGGTLADEAFREEGRKSNNLSRKDKLEFAVQAASGMADLHAIDSVHGYAAMAHTDIMLDQWVWTDDRYKLNDFNRGHLLFWDEKNRRSCPYYWNENTPGNFRSPEEYKGEFQTEKIDVFSLGNVIYGIMTGDYPFDDLEMEDAQKRVKEGEFPPINPEIRHSDHPVDKALMKAMEMCFTYHLKERPSALEVKDFLADFKENYGRRQGYNG